MIWALIFGALFATSYASNLPVFEQKLLSTDDNDAALSAMCDDIAHRFENEYVNYMRTGVESSALRILSEQLAKSHTKKILTSEVDDLSASDKAFTCTTCRATVNVIIRMFREGGEFAGPENEELLRSTTLDFCRRFEVSTDEVCEGLFDLNLPILRFIISNTEIDSKSFCGTFLTGSFCKVTNEAFNWKLTISNGPAIEGPKTDIPSKGDNDLNILHITDIHYDPLYVVGSLAECDEPHCCQRHKNIAEGTSKAAGHWGDYRSCDLPWHTIVESLSSIRKNHPKIDYVYHTGDMVDHAVWLTSREKNQKTMEDINTEFKNTFGSIPVFPTIGNHENHPLNVFAPSDVSDSDLSAKWLYEFLADLWSVWLPASTKETIKQGGYYTVVPRAGFRIIALNNNECYIYNWWIVYDGNFLSNQLKWLHDTLLEAEQKAEHVHILAHIPTGSTGCWSVWSREFSRIVERFSNTISGIFNGHTHRDELNLYYTAGKTPINIAWNGGSLTTFTDKNPNYKLYQVEPTSFQVVEQETWYFNLTKANLDTTSLAWESEYKFSEEYGLKDLSPASIDGLLTKFAKDPKLLRKYYKYYVVQGDPKLASGCSETCLKKILCMMGTGDNTQTERCVELRDILQEALDTEGSGEGSGDGSGEGSGDGAASIMALKITSIITFYIASKFIL